MLPSGAVEHHNHYKQRFEAITDPTQMPDDLLFSFLLSSEIVRVGRELTSDERLIVLDLYVAWYANNGKELPFPEWVRKNRERWSKGK